MDKAGNLFIADFENHRIRRVTPDGIISTVAGTGIPGFSGDGGPATLAKLNGPSGIAVDAAGNMFITDSLNDCVRKVTPDGVIQTIVSSAYVFNPDSVAVDAAGNLFIANPYPQNVLRVSPDGVISVAATGLHFPEGVAVDGLGNSFIADTGNHRVVKVTPGDFRRTLAGSFGARGFSGDDGPASDAKLDSPFAVAVDGSGNLFIADSGNNRIRMVAAVIPPEPFTITDRGGLSMRTSGTSRQTAVGYASIRPDSGSTTPSGLAIFGFRQNNVLVTEAGVPASPLVQSGRIYAEVNEAANTGLALANPNSEPATVSFFFSDLNGDFGHGSTTIPANRQIAAFLNQSPFNGTSFRAGTVTFSSSVPIAATALRGLTNERGDFLITSLPVIDLNAPAPQETVVFPHFADGGGWTTQIVLVNSTDAVLTGTVQFLTPSGQSTTVIVGGQSNNSFAYSIPARASQKFQTSGTAASVRNGSVRVVPHADIAPSGVAIFSLRNAGITVAEVGVAAVLAGTAFRVYAEASGDFRRGAVGSIQTGFAVANRSNNAAVLTVELHNRDGSSTGLTGKLPVPANGQAALFLNQVQGLETLQMPFEGVLRLSSPEPISLIGLRGRYNERRDFLVTTTPPVNENDPTSTSVLFFPHIADSGGYTTQFILFCGQPGLSFSGTLRFFSQFGGAWDLLQR